MADLTQAQKAAEPSRRRFLQRLGELAASSAVLAHAPWLLASVHGALARPDAQKVRMAIIGVGARGGYLLNNMLLSPSCAVVGVCDDYGPHLERALDLTEHKARGFADYRALLDWGEFDAAVIATPLHLHAEMTLASFDAGKHVLCEKSMARTIAQAVSMINKAHETRRVLQIGHQRMFSPHYIEVAEQVHEGRLGKIVQIRSYWHRNGDWRRTGFPPQEERRFNWRLYRDYSGGLCTELGSHQIQVADWMFQGRVERVSGSGSIAYWRDGREVHDHVALVYDYSDGRKHIWDSMCSNRYYGAEEQIMGDKGTIEAEAGDFYDEDLPPAPGLQQLIRDVAGGAFNKLPLAASSYQGERKSRAAPHPIVSRRPPPVYEEGVHQFEAFTSAVRDGRASPGLLPYAFNATVAALMGEETAFTGESRNWPQLPELIEGALQ